jgi:protein gp37
VAETSTIEWTHATWSPWEGCTKVSPGCDHCYAEGMNRWLRKGENWGPGAPRRGYSDAHWEKPLRWNDKAKAEGRSLRVFPSVCDPFDNEVDPAWRARFFALIAGTPHLTWLLLTKRIGNVAAMIEAPGMQKCGLPPNVWLGATIVNREEMLRDGPKLKAVCARVTFWSVEPMLGALGQIPRDLLPSWVICGGESGHGARPMHPMWARDIRDQCWAAGIPFLFKQWGEWLPVELPSSEECYAEDGSDRALEGHIRVQRIRHRQDMAHVGKKTAGRLLDGVTHDGFPEQAR